MRVKSLSTYNRVTLFVGEKKHKAKAKTKFKITYLEKEM